MKQKLLARYDGEALQLEEPVDLEFNAEYTVTVEKLASSNGKRTKRKMNQAIARILSRAEDLGPSDLAAQHDHYLYGLPKR